jgi:hypothetical protein
MSDKLTTHLQFVEVYNANKYKKDLVNKRYGGGDAKCIFGFTWTKIYIGSRRYFSLIKRHHDGITSTSDREILVSSSILVPGNQK